MQDRLSRCRSAAAFPRYTFLMLLLSVAVFTWGLHYKLSLYSAPTQSSTAQVTAKLLSQQERTEPQTRQLADTEPLLLPVLFALLLTAFFPAITSMRLIRRPSLQPLRSSHPSGMSKALFRRPPPATFPQL